MDKEDYKLDFFFFLVGEILELKYFIFIFLANF